MKNATLSSYYNSSAFDPPEDQPLPSDVVGTGFDDDLIDLLDEIECEENFGSSINWYVAAQKCEAMMKDEMRDCERNGWEFDICDMTSDFIKIIKDCD